MRKKRRQMLGACLLLFTWVTVAPMFAQQPPSALWVGAQGTGLLPVGDLATCTSAAAGGSIGISAEDFLVQHLRLGLDFAYGYFFPSVSWVSSVHEVEAIARAGYRFDLSPVLAVTPQLGGGVGVGIGIGQGKTNVGAQLVAAAGATLGWKFQRDWQLEANLEYVGIGELVDWYSGFEAGIGVAWRLPLFDAAPSTK